MSDVNHYIYCCFHPSGVGAVVVGKYGNNMDQQSITPHVVGISISTLIICANNFDSKNVNAVRILWFIVIWSERHEDYDRSTQIIVRNYFARNEIFTYILYVYNFRFIIKDKYIHNLITCSLKSN